MAAMQMPFGETSNVILRNRDGGWSLMVEMATLEDAAAVLGRMGSDGPVTAHIETLNPDGRYVRKGQVQIGETVSPWRVEKASEATAPPPPPPAEPPATIGASFKLLVVSLAQIFFGLFGLLLVGAVIFQVWFFVSDHLGELTSTARANAEYASSPIAYTMPTSSPYSTPGLSYENGIYLAERVEVLAVILEFADACALDAREVTTDKFINPVIQRFKLNAADVGLIRQQLAVVPAASCTLTLEERLYVVGAVARLMGEGVLHDVLGAFGDTMTPLK